MSWVTSQYWLSGLISMCKGLHMSIKLYLFILEVRIIKVKSTYPTLIK